MFKCCDKDVKSICEQLEFKVTETPKGVQVEITAKDASKTESLKTLVKSLRDFCECC